MSQHTGPRLFYSLEAISECMTNSEQLSLQSPLFLVDDDDERQWQLKEFCTPLLIGVQHPTEHFERLDAHFSSLLPNALSSHPSLLSPRAVRTEDTHRTQAKEILHRLPRTPQRLFSLPFNNSGLRKGRDTIWDGIKDGRWASKYVVPKALSQLQLHSSDEAEAVMDLIRTMQDVAWNNLYVTTFIDTNSVVLTTQVSLLGTSPDLVFARDFLSYINILAELLDEFDGLVNLADFGITEPLSDPAPSVQALKSALFPEVYDQHEQGRAVQKAFLWTAWQRSVMLYFYYVIGVQLWQGYSSTWNALLAIRGIRRLEALDSQFYRGDSTDYLCNWAFELLRTSRSSLGLDFRTMLNRFDTHFQSSVGRCIKGSGLTCDGDRPESCQRFTGAETKSQTAHAAICNGTCPKVRWS